MSAPADANDELQAGTLLADFVPFELQETGQGESVASLWGSVGDASAADGECWLTDRPPPRRYLLSTKAKTAGWNIAEPQGVLPMGKVGMLAAAGGAGKSWALMQLALAVATGRSWLDAFEVSTPGYVLMTMGEEERLEARRRMYYAAQRLHLREDEVQLVKDRVILLPLCGKPVCLTQETERGQAKSDFGNAMETKFAEALRTRLRNAGHPWSLIIFDPMSRFAGPDVEIDNAAATRFVQALERFTEAPGNPTVLVAHHTNKAARTGATVAGAARGSSALTDGVRWQANLDPLPGNAEDSSTSYVQLHVTKSNYGLFPDPVTLVRDAESHGALRAATPKELEGIAGAREDAAIESSVKRKITAAKAKERFESIKKDAANDDGQLGEDALK